MSIVNITTYYKCKLSDSANGANTRTMWTRTDSFVRIDMIVCLYAIWSKQNKKKKNKSQHYIVISNLNCIFRFTRAYAMVSA